MTRVNDYVGKEYIHEESERFLSLFAMCRFFLHGALKLGLVGGGGG